MPETHVREDRYRPKLNHVCLYPRRWLIHTMKIAGFRNAQLSPGGMFVRPLDRIPIPYPWCCRTIAVAQEDDEGV